jgi:steroid 5-alpha reductase family enzyme
MVFRSSRRSGFIVCVLAYLTAIFVCYLFGSVFYGSNVILYVFILVILATVTIFLISMLVNNSSIFDPYWSLAPPVIFLYWIFEGKPVEGNIIRQSIIIGLVIFWSIRLTWNWIRRWQGLIDEDWRYRNFRKKYPSSYWLVSFFGIHLFPSLVVFVACVSVYPALMMRSPALNIIDLIAGTVTLAGIVIETIADQQLRKHLRKGREQPFLSEGLWKYSRHPNYFGEVLFWIGLFIFSLSSDTLLWWIFPGPVIMLLLFFFVSAPMTDKRMLQRRRGYREYYKKTSGLIPWFVKKSITHNEVFRPDS